MSVKKIRTGQFVVDYRDVRKKRHRKTFSTKAAADKYDRLMLSTRDSGALPATATPTLTEIIPEWRASTRPALRDSTWRGYERGLKLHILPRIGNVRCGEFTQLRLQQFVTELHDSGMSAVMIQRVFATLSVVLTHASMAGYCQAPSKKGIKFPLQTMFEAHPPTVPQLERLADSIDARFYALIILCGYCGLRQSEALALSPGDVQFQNHRIRVHASLERTTHSIVPRTKSGKNRFVTMPTRVEEALRLHMAEYPCERLVFHRDEQLVEATWFHHQIWTPARVKAGLPEIRFHDLRHGAATIMAELGGWGPKKVQVELGHSTAAFTMDRYGHLWEDVDEEKRDFLDAAIKRKLAEASSPSGSRTRTPRGATDFESVVSAIPPSGHDDHTVIPEQ